MTFEQGCIAVITALLGALLWCVRVLFSKSEQCEGDRRELRQEIEDMKTANGKLEGFQKAIELCPVPGCIFRQGRPARHTVAAKTGKGGNEGGGDA